MKCTTLIFLTTLFCSLTFAQVGNSKKDTTKSVYKNLKTLKYIQGDYDNNEKVMEECTPCILKTYDGNGNLLTKGIEYEDCPCGFWIEYFPNGKVKLTGHYKENESNDWSNALEEGLCKRDGTFTHFNEKGEKLYSEYWKDGQFIKQVPKQTKTELWNVELTLDSVKVDKQVLTPKQVSEIKITPQFKNSSTAGTNISIKFVIRAIGHTDVEQTFTIDNFNTIDVQAMLTKAGIKSSEMLSYTLEIYNNGEIFINYYLTIKP